VTRIAMLTIITTFTIVGVVYFFVYRSPRDFSLGHAVAVLGLAAVATASTEYARETIRKPYVIGAHMYSNGVRKRDVARYNEEGYLTHSIWKPAAQDGIALGHAMFRGQCMSCHTVSGYRSMKRLLQARDQKGIDRLLEMLHNPPKDSMYVKYMPPLVGRPEEIAALGQYLATLSGAPTSPPLTPEAKQQARLP
jgi:mono/diheme cytochrome c family protein